jgi:hypothetical protein
MVDGTLEMEIYTASPPSLRILSYKHTNEPPTTTPGFEVKNGRSVPVIEGVVVLQRDEAALLDAYGVSERVYGGGENRTAATR